MYKKIFSEAAIKKMSHMQHEHWESYRLIFGKYALHIHMPNETCPYAELFLNRGKNELTRELIVSPEYFRALNNIIINGGIYIEYPKKTLLTQLLKVFYKPRVYFVGINLAGNDTSKMNKIY